MQQMNAWDLLRITIPRCLNPMELKEVFYTISKRGVIRATHFQLRKQQSKLVRYITDHIYDVTVGLRPKSPTFRQWRKAHLTGDNTHSLLVPAQFGYGYLIIEDAIVRYKCLEEFYGQGDSGIMYDNPEISIEWLIDLVGEREKFDH